jgi:hypothetical protein
MKFNKLVKDVKETKIGPRNFFDKESSWWLQNGAPKEKLYLRIVSNWKDIQN